MASTDEESVRKEFERQLGAPVHKRAWGWTVKYDDVVSYCIGRASDDIAWRDLRDAYDRNRGRIRDQDEERRSAWVNQDFASQLTELEPEDEREKTLQFALAALVLRDPQVRRFQRWLETDLVPAEILDRMRSELVTRLRNEYALPDDYFHGVLNSAGAADRFLHQIRSSYHSSIRMAFRRNIGDKVTLGRLTIEVSPWVSERRLAAEYRRTRQMILGRGVGSRQIPVRTLMVLQFVEVSQLYEPDRTFRSMAREWNELVDQGATLLGEKFENDDSMTRTYRNGLKALLHPAYLTELVPPVTGSKTYTVKTIRESAHDGQEIMRRRMAPRRGVGRE